MQDLKAKQVILRSKDGQSEAHVSDLSGRLSGTLPKAVGNILTILHGLGCRDRWLQAVRPRMWGGLVKARSVSKSLSPPWPGSGGTG